MLLFSLLLLLPTKVGATTEGKYYEKLDSNWQFYEHQLLSGIDQENSNEKSLTVSLPVEFEKITGEISTYGTFVKTIEIPKQFIGKTLGIEIPYVYGAVKIFANGELLTEIGKVGTSARNHETNLQSIIVPVKFEQSKITLAVQLSSFEHIRGGFSEALSIGDWDSISDAFERERLIGAFLVGIIFIAGGFTTLIGLLSQDEKVLLTFGLFSIGVAIRAIFGAPFIYHELPFEISYLLATKIESILTSLVFMLYVVFIYLLFKRIVYKPVFIVSEAILVIIAILSLVTEPITFQTAFLMGTVLIAAFMLYSVMIIIRAVKLKLGMGKPLLLGILCVFIGEIYNLLKGIGLVKFPSISLYTVSANVILILLCLGKRYTSQLVKVKQLNMVLENINQTLDDKVKERTMKLMDANIKLSELAMKDGLTGIFNRYKFNELLKYYFDKAKMNNDELSLIMIDVDEFKKYNDTYGHVHGDQLLKEIVEIIQLQLPEDAIFARYGGEEFVIILPNFSEQQARQIGDKVRLAVKDANIEHQGREEGIVTISLGGVERKLQGNITNENELVEIADKRLYDSKNNGRDCMTFQKNMKFIQ